MIWWDKKHSTQGKDTTQIQFLVSLSTMLGVDPKDVTQNNYKNNQQQQKDLKSSREFCFGDMA